MTVGEWQLARQRLEYNGTNRNYSGNRRNDCHFMVVHMSDYKWCHGPKCHESRTQDRIRGSKGNKVLRTRRIKQDTESQWYSPDGVFNFFCSQTCLMNFMRANIQRVLALAPRHEPLETPIEDPRKVTRHSQYNSDYTWTETEIKDRVDTSME